MNTPHIGSPPELDAIISKLQIHMPDLKRRYSVNKLGVFGSFARNEQTRDSDIDLLVEFARSPDIFAFMEMEEDLSLLLGRKVDLVTVASLNGEIGKRILQEVVPKGLFDE